jgi:diaminopimelate decarboxylase
MPAPPASNRPCPLAGSAEFSYRDGELFCEGMALTELAARFGTPLYVYSQASLTQRYATVRAAFGAAALVCYAVKANSNLSLLRHFAGLGAGFDLVSGGELQRLVAAGVDPRGAVFAGVAKQPWEIEAAVRAGIRFFNLESPHELPLLAAAGRKHGVRVPVAVRLNPDVDADTHAYVATGRSDSKFGVGLAMAGALVEQIAVEPHLRLCGYHVHLGSQLRSASPYLDAFSRVEEFLGGAAVRREGIEFYDLGGGFGLGYGSGPPLDVATVAAALLPRLAAHGLRPVVEPGRYLVGDAGVLLTTVLGHKTTAATRFVLVDAAMNDLLRPALYQAAHPIVPVRDAGGTRHTVDVVGPVCESGDFLGRQRDLPATAPGDLLAVLTAGAYGFSMASNYNSRPRPAEVMVDGARVRLIRRREALERLWIDEVEL